MSETPGRKWKQKGFLGFVKHFLRRQRQSSAVVLKTVAGIPVNQSPDCRRYEDFEINKLHKLGEGTYGKVYEACQGNNCGDYVAKIVSFDPDHLSDEQKNFLVESLMAKVAGDAGFGVPVKSFFFCDNGKSGVLIMRKFENPGRINASDLLKLLDKIRLMHQNRILHTDLYRRNILRDPKTKELFIIDFGLAFFLSKAVPESLQVSDVAGLLFGQPPELEAGIADQDEATAFQVWEKYAETVRPGSLQTGLNMKVNAEGTIDDPYAGGAPYKIDCDAYYDLISSMLAPIFQKRLGQENILSREVWTGEDICAA